MLTLKRIHLREVDSTNIYIKKVEESNVIVTADFQTKGKGQGTNRWESEDGQNLTFSIKVSPKEFPVCQYFMLSMTGALALFDVLNKEVGDISLKWPNDIYWKNKKISGTLIETAISGKFIQNCILGIGINVNQKSFVSDAPNPVSLWQITGREYNREELLERIISSFCMHYNMLLEGKTDRIIRLYHEHLYRKDGFYEYEDNSGVFLAKIKEVLSNGHIILTDTEEQEREYEFKEVRFRL